MLNPSYLLHAPEPAEEIAEKLHQDIMDRIIERILIRFQNGDDYILTALDKWQIETLQQAGYLLEDIQKEIAAAVPYMIEEIAEAMEDAGVEALKYDDAIHRGAGLDPVPLVQSPHLIQVMQRDYQATYGTWDNYTRTIAQAGQRSFIRCCDEAYHKAISGTISPAQAIKEALDEMITDGVYVQYDTRRDTIETATTRAVRTGISQASAHIQIARMDEMDVDLVLVSSHLGARPSHYEWQGKVYTRSGLNPKYPDFETVTGYGTVTGLCGANCRHSFSPYFEGQKNPFEHYDSEENKKQYELEQRQRTLERRIRDTKRQTMNWKTAMENEKDPVKRAAYEAEYQQKAALLQKQNKAYNDFCKSTGQKKRDDRISIAKWDRKQAAQAREAAKKHQKPVANTIKSGKMDVRMQRTPLLNEETKPAENRMPNSLRAVTDHNKIQRYALNSNHPRGKEKARVFNSVLGYHYENWDALSDQIFDRLQTSDVAKHEVTQYGQRYKVPMRIYGLKNKSMVVNTVWQIDNGAEVPRLITITFDKRTIRSEQ